MAADPARLQQLAYDPALGVVADDTRQGHFGVQGRQHRRHIARPAQPVLFAGDAENGNRGLRADPLDVAPEVAIKHHIAQHEDVRA